MKRTRSLGRKKKRTKPNTLNYFYHKIDECQKQKNSCNECSLADIEACNVIWEAYVFFEHESTLAEQSKRRQEVEVTYAAVKAIKNENVVLKAEVGQAKMASWADGNNDLGSKREIRVKDVEFEDLAKRYGQVNEQLLAAQLERK
ncbi:Uncharacterized protein Adt_35716 [Abeliophyllum distichum]|uniref:Uncharacterized protein n=1 Tax=Abeliophyllum distichum TaxID=126358 RepID=A0ABD1QFI5_9LAMI